MTALYHSQQAVLPVSFQIVRKQSITLQAVRRNGAALSGKSVCPGDDKTGGTESDTVPICSDRRTVRIRRKYDVRQA